MLIAASPAPYPWLLVVIQFLLGAVLGLTVVRAVVFHRRMKRETRRQQEEHRLFIQEAMQRQQEAMQHAAQGLGQAMFVGGLSLPLPFTPDEYTERLIALFPEQADAIRHGQVRVTTKSKRQWDIAFCGGYWGVQCNNASLCVHATHVQSLPQKAYAFALWLLADEQAVLREARPWYGY